MKLQAAKPALIFPKKQCIDFSPPKSWLEKYGKWQYNRLIFLLVQEKKIV